MTATLRPPVSACPACAATPASETLAARASAQTEAAQITLSLPTIHCAACMSKVEHALMQDPKVQSARVNLTLKRVAVQASPPVSPPRI